jgi:hypothetical protein
MVLSDGLCHCANWTDRGVQLPNVNNTTESNCKAPLKIRQEDPCYEDCELWVKFTNMI